MNGTPPNPGHGMLWDFNEKSNFIMMVKDKYTTGYYFILLSMC